MNVKKMQDHIVFLHWLVGVLGACALICFIIIIPTDNQIITDWKRQRYYSRLEVEEEIKAEHMIAHDEILHLKASIKPACFKPKIKKENVNAVPASR